MLGVADSINSEADFRDVSIKDESHQPQKPVACTNCGQTFSPIHEIREHLKERTAQTNAWGYCAKADDCNSNHKESQPAYYIPSCNKSGQGRFLQQTEVKEHLEMTHADDGEALDEPTPVESSQMLLTQICSKESKGSEEA